MSIYFQITSLLPFLSKTEKQKKSEGLKGHNKFFRCLCPQTKPPLVTEVLDMLQGKAVQHSFRRKRASECNRDQGCSGSAVHNRLTSVTLNGAVKVYNSA